MVRVALFICIALAFLLGACASAPRSAPVSPGGQHSAKAPATKLALDHSLPDRSYFHQQDARWADVPLGASGSTLSAEGCLVTAAAMALSNLGFKTDPGDLTFRLKAHDGFTSRGWLVWQGLERVTGGKAKTKFYSTADMDHVQSCLSEGYYPLVRFALSSRRSHWAMVVGTHQGEYYLRDPMVALDVPIPLSSRTDGISAVRCIGLAS